MRELFAVVFSLAVVLALIYVSVRLYKVLLKRMNIGGFGGGSGIDIVSSIGLGTDKSIAAVQVGEKKLLLAVTSTDIKILTELSDEDMKILRESAPSGSERSFGEILKENTMKTLGLDSAEKKDGKQ